MEERIQDFSEAEETAATNALLRTMQQLAEKCDTIEEFREALKEIVAKTVGK